MRSNSVVTFLLLNLKKKNFQERYNVQNVFCEFMRCTGDREMWSFPLPSAEAALKNSFRNLHSGFLKNIMMFLQIYMQGKTQEMEKFASLIFWLINKSGISSSKAESLGKTLNMRICLYPHASLLPLQRGCFQCETCLCWAGRV